MGRRAACPGWAKIAGTGAAAQAALRIDREGQAKRAQAAGAVRSDEPAIGGMDRQRLLWIARRWLVQWAEVILRAASDAVELLGRGVMGFEVGVAEWPV